MNILVVALYFTSAIIRPADWFGPLLGLPLDTYIAYLMGVLAFVTGKLPVIQEYLFRKEVRLVLLSFAVSMVATLLGGDFNVFLTQASYYGKMVLFYLALLAFTATPKGQKDGVAVFVVLVGIVAYQGIVQYTTGMGWATELKAWAGKIPRAKWVGMYDGPNVYCVLLNIGFAFALQFLVGPWGKPWKAFSLLACGLIVPAVYYTNSRGGYLAFIAVIAMTVWLRSLKMDQKIEIRRLVVICAVVGVLLVLGPSRIGEIKDSEGSASGRIGAWYEGILMLKEKPLLGVGLGNWAKHHHLLAHNNFVQNMGEVGFVGLYCWLLMVYAHVVSLFRALAVTSDPRDRSMIAGLLVGLGSMLLSSMFLSTNEFDLWYVLFALSGAFLYTRHHEVRITRRDMKTVLVLEVVGIALVSLTIRIFNA